MQEKAESGRIPDSKPRIISFLPSPLVKEQTTMS